MHAYKPFQVKIFNDKLPKAEISFFFFFSQYAYTVTAKKNAKGKGW